MIALILSSRHAQVLGLRGLVLATPPGKPILEEIREQLVSQYAQAQQMGSELVEGGLHRPCQPWKDGTREPVGAWQRWSPLSGILFVVLGIVSLSMDGLEARQTVYGQVPREG